MSLEEVNGNYIRITRKIFLSLWCTTAEYRKRYTKEIKKERIGNTARHESWAATGVMKPFFLNFAVYGR